MKTLRTLFLILLALCLVLPAAAEEDPADYIGTWELFSANTVNGPITREEMLAAGLDLSMTVIFREDGSCEVSSVTNGEEDSDTGTWSLAEHRIYTIGYNEFSLEDGVLAVRGTSSSGDDGTLYFRRTEAPVADPVPAAADALGLWECEYYVSLDGRTLTMEDMHALMPEFSAPTIEIRGDGTAVTRQADGNKIIVPCDVAAGTITYSGIPSAFTIGEDGKLVITTPPQDDQGRTESAVFRRPGGETPQASQAPAGDPVLASLVGTWQVTSLEPQIDAAQIADLREQGFWMEMVFDETGTASVITYQGGEVQDTEEGAFRYEDGKLVSSSYSTVTFTVEGDTLTIDDDGDIIVLTRTTAP